MTWVRDCENCEKTGHVVIKVGDVVTVRHCPKCNGKGTRTIKGDDERSPYDVSNKR